MHADACGDRCRAPGRGVEARVVLDCIHGTLARARPRVNTGAQNEIASKNGSPANPVHWHDTGVRHVGLAQKPSMENWISLPAIFNSARVAQ